MSIRSSVVQWMDQHTPRLISAARYHVHVSLRGDVVYPAVTRVLFDRLGSTEASAIDVGANVGIFSNYLAAHFREVVAVEPIPYLAASLKRSLPRACRVEELALGDSEGAVVLRVPIDEAGREMHAQSTASADNALGLITNTGHVEHTVRMRRLDDIAAEMHSLAFVKIDVEGFEGAVLAGATKMLTVQRPVIQLEIGRAHNPKYPEILTLLDKLNYRGYAMRKEGLCVDVECSIQAQPTVVGNDEAGSPSGIWDYLFVPRERDEILSAGLVRSADL